MAATKRPFAVTCLIGLVLTLTGLQAFKLWAVLSSWDYLNSLPLKIPPALLGLSAAAWLALGLALAWGLWRAKAWAPPATRWAALAFAAVHWLDRLFLQAGESQSSNWPFDLVLSAALLASVFSILALPNARAYFGDKA